MKKFNYLTYLIFLSRSCTDASTLMLAHKYASQQMLRSYRAENRAAQQRFPFRETDSIH